MTEVFADDFDRTVAVGLGTSPDTTEWSNVVNDDAYVQPAGGGQPGYAANPTTNTARYQGLPLIQDGQFLFDFWVPGDRDDGNIEYRLDGQDVLVTAPSTRYFPTIQILANGDGSTYFVTSGSGLSDDIPVAANTWYRCRFEVTAAAAGGTERFRVWKASLPEPSTWDQSGSVLLFSRPPLSDSQIGFRFAGGLAYDPDIDDYVPQEARFTNLHVYTDHVDTVIWDPTSPHFGGETEPAPHDVPCTVKIEVAGADVTDLIMVESADFESAASGQVGTCEFWVKDLEHASSFVTGDEILLKLDDVVQWRGFVTQVSRRYAFAVDRTIDPTATPRFIVVRGSDHNILFSKRYVFNKADITKGAPILPQHTADNTAIAILGNDYLDLSGDGISTSGVTHVEDFAPDSEIEPWRAGMSWGEAMQVVCSITGGLFYIDPDKVLRYVSAEAVTAPWAVSDNPDGSVSFGVRELRITRDGSGLATDALVWGAGLGSKDMHFGRYTSPAYEAIHGKWQWADYRQDLYHDASLLKRAKSYVDGTVNGRGHRDDAISAEFVLFKRGLRVGQVVTVQCLTYQFNMPLPIRSMRINFVGAQRQASDGSFKWFVRFTVRAATFLEDPWSNAEFPTPISVRPPKIPNCQFVPRSEACTDEGWTPVFYDPFDRDGWTLAGPWGDPGCVAWGHETHTSLTGTEWVHVGPGPWCIVYASRNHETVTIGDGSTLADPKPFVFESSFNVTANPNGTLNGNDLGWGGVFNYYLRIQRLPGYIRVTMWKQGDNEPDFHTYYQRTGWDDMVPGFTPNSLMGEDLRISTNGQPGQISVSTAAGEGWAYYTDAFLEDQSVYHHDWVAIHPSYAWTSRFWPAGTFPVNPDIVGSVQPIDAICTSLGVPLFARDDGGDHEAMNFADRKLYDLHWAWNSDNGLDGTTQADGRMIVRNRHMAGFLAPQGATTVEFTARVYINAPETGIFSLGSQPGPSGEGDLSWEIWDVDPSYDGSAIDDVSDPAHTVIASGTLADYTYKDGDGGPITIYEDITFSRSIAAGEIFQIGGKITNSDSDLINTHGPASSFAINSGGRRVVELKITNSTVKFNWEPTACGPEQGVVGFQQKAVNCKEDSGRPFCEVPKFLLSSEHTYETVHDYVNDSLVLYVDGKRLTWGVDYVETDPENGHFDYLVEDGDQSERLSACYNVRDHQIFPLPKADPHYNKHPGYVGSPEDYHPAHVAQLGWGTAFDAYNCTCATAAVYLDAVTYGAQRATPPEIRNRQSDFSGGISLFDAADALATYGVTLHVHSNAAFSSFDAALVAGPVMMAGLYSQIPAGFSSQLSFLGGHSMLALCWSETKKAILVYDPLNTAPIWMPTQMVRNYMEAFNGGSGCDYGATI
jgi:hypothetical protein